MAKDYIARAKTIDVMLDLIDSDRIAAAQLAEATFHQDVGYAISTIEQITALASARVVADSQVASAKMQIDAEVAATRLMADTQLAIEQYKQYFQTQDLAVPRDVVSGVIRQVSGHHAEQSANQVKSLIESIESDAQLAISKLKAMGNAAIEEVNNLVASITSNVETDATIAAEKLRAFRQKEHTIDEISDEAEHAALMIEVAAAKAAADLGTTVTTAIENIRLTTDEACKRIEATVKVSTERILEAREKSLDTFRMVLMSYYTP